MAQFGRPSSDITVSGWTNSAGGGTMYTALDEATASDSDYVWSANNTANTLEVKLSTLTDPVSSSSHTFRYRIARMNNGTIDGGGNSTTVTAYLYQGGTLIATDTARTTSGTWTQYELTISGAEADSITDYTDLRLRFDVSSSGGSPANRRGNGISWGELEVPTAVINYTLACNGGSHSYSGQDSSLLKNSVVSATTDSYSYSGQDATLTYAAGYTLNALGGSYSYSGQDATLTYVISYSLSALSGSYSYSGQDVGFLRDRNVIANSDSYSVSGQDVNFLYSRTLVANGDSVTYSGQDVSFNKGILLSASSGSYNITGQDVSFTYNRNLTTNEGTHTISGSSVNTLYNRVLASNSDNYQVTGQNATLTYNQAANEYTLVCDGGVYSSAGSSIQLIVDYLISASSDSTLVSGTDVSFLYQEALQGDNVIYVNINSSQFAINVTSVKNIDVTTQSDTINKEIGNIIVNING